MVTTEQLSANDFIGLYESTKNKDFLRSAADAGSAIHGELSYVLSLLDEPLSYEQKLEALKYGIQNGKGVLYDPRTPVGELYRELFWDPDVDPVFYYRLSHA